MKTNQDFLDMIHDTKNHQEQTKKGYKCSTNIYCDFHQKTLEELFKEADNEEKEGILWRDRKLKQRLIDFRTHMINSNKYQKNTINHYYIRIKTIYRFFGFEIGDITDVELADNAPIRYKDLPDKEILRKALEVAKPRMKAIITFMASSGCGRTETYNLTIQDYIEATKEYHDGGSIEEILNTLEKIDDVVPTFHLFRQKTKKYYYTFCSPEAVHYINDYLLTEDRELKLNDKLFDVGYSSIGKDFIRLNDKLKLGKVQSYNRLRPHMLRKFHASSLYNDGMSRDTINDLQGKTMNTTDQSYFFINDESLKEEYIDHVVAVTLKKEVEKVTVKSKEFREMEFRNIELQNENITLKEEVSGIVTRLDKIEKLTWDDIKEEY